MQESLLPAWFGAVKQASISGLDYHEEILSLSDELALIRSIDQEQWQNPHQRRVQNYGAALQISQQARTLPPFMQVIADRLHRDGYLPKPATQLIVNEYLPGQGIGAHIDNADCGEHIAIINVGSDACMELSKEFERQHLILNRRSLCILSGQARWQWQHAIPKRHSDLINGVRRQSQRRLSLTFRIAAN